MLKLRSKITHGEIVDTSAIQYVVSADVQFGHFTVAEIVFYECILQELYDVGLLGSEIRETISLWTQDSKIDDMPRFEESVKDWHLSFCKIHQVLGWEPTRVKKDYSEADEV